jgi:hypothetical protein
MSSKRNIEEVETSDSGPEPQSTADIAELLRQQLIKSASSKKQRRVRKRRAIDIDTIVPALSVSGFFKLPREVRDQIYGLAWEASPRIRQQYKRKIYHVTYGDQGDLEETGTHTYEVSNHCSHLLWHKLVVMYTAQANDFI